MIKDRDPRWVTLLVLPALVAAGAVTAEPQAPPRPRTTGAAVHGPPALRALPAVASTDAPEAAADRHEPAAPTALTRTGSRSGPSSGRTATVEQRGQEALRSLSYDWRALGYSIVFRPYDGHGLGSANRLTRTITVYVRPRQSELTLRTSLAHEIGHALDFEHGSQDRRDAYRRIRGLPADTAWFPCNRCDDYASPAGDFAEVFAAWLVGPGDFRGRLKGPPGPQELRELAPIFRLPTRSTGQTPRPTPTASPQTQPQEEPSGPLPALLGAAPGASPSPSTPQPR